MDKCKSSPTQKISIIAIDGPAGSGKSTVARLLATRLGFVYIDTGAMYRAVTYKAMQLQLDLQCEEKIVALCKSLHMAFIPQGVRIQVLIEGEDVTSAIRTLEVTENVSHIAKMPKVREQMVAMQRAMGQESKKAVMEGRDIGSVVFPDAYKKIYLDASDQERALRRWKELNAKGVQSSLEEILKSIQERDKKDLHRTVGALKKMPDAIYVDTTNMSIEQVVDKLVEIVQL